MSISNLFENNSFDLKAESISINTVSSNDVSVNDIVEFTENTNYNWKVQKYGASSLGYFVRNTGTG